MFVVDWFWYLLYKLGFLKKKATILLLGLDNAGKTTLMHKLKYGTVRLVIPTQRALVEEIVIGNVKFRTWDLGGSFSSSLPSVVEKSDVGHEQVRSLWKEYFFEADAVIFVLDSADHERLEEAKQELTTLLDDPNLAHVPFLILANKTDLENSMPYDKLVTALDLQQSLTEEQQAKRPVKMFRCSLIEGSGYEDGFTWLSDIL